MRATGLVAMARTGSDVFYLSPDGRHTTIGGFGAILGDDGSGVWIGQQALRKAIAYEEGWGEQTAFLPLLREAWNLRQRDDIIERVHGEPAPYRKVASVLPLLA